MFVSAAETVTGTPPLTGVIVQVSTPAVTRFRLVVSNTWPYMISEARLRPIPCLKRRRISETIPRMSITLDLDEQALDSLPLQAGERERLMQIELACRFYANGWLTLGMGARMAGLDHYAFGVALAERAIPRQYGLTEAQEDLAHARRQ
jgi:predicted HTH domain antitoxin